MSGTTWNIYGQDGPNVVLLKHGSVRLGRTMRRAAAIKKYMQASVFVAKHINASPPERHYPGATERQRLIDNAQAKRHAAPTVQPS